MVISRGTARHIRMVLHRARTIEKRFTKLMASTVVAVGKSTRLSILICMKLKITANMK